jgi:hypothetical protein
LNYVRKELSHKNEKYVLVKIKDRLEQKKAAYQKATGQKMQAKASPIREGVIVISEKTTMEQLKQYADKIKERFGIEAIQIYTHKDEGHTDKNGEWKCNLHAHMVFDWTDDKGKTIKMHKDHMSEMQTILADCLGMERCASSDIKHLNAIQYKAQEEQKKLKEIQKEISFRNKAEQIVDFVTLGTKGKIAQKEAQISTLTEQVDELHSELLKAAKANEISQKMNFQLLHQTETLKQQIRELNLEPTKAVQRFISQLNRELRENKIALEIDGRGNEKYMKIYLNRPNDRNRQQELNL